MEWVGKALAMNTTLQHGVLVQALWLLEHSSLIDPAPSKIPSVGAVRRREQPTIPWEKQEVHKN